MWATIFDVMKKSTLFHVAPWTLLNIIAHNDWRHLIHRLRSENDQRSGIPLWIQTVSHLPLINQLVDLILLCGSCINRISGSISCEMICHFSRWPCFSFKIQLNNHSVLNKIKQNIWIYKLLIKVEKKRTKSKWQLWWIESLRICRIILWPIRWRWHHLDWQHMLANGK